MEKIDRMFEIINNSPLYIAVKEKGAKKHTPYSFKNGYTNILGATRFGLDKIEGLKDNINKSVEASKVGLSMQIVNSKTNIVIYRYSNI